MKIPINQIKPSKKPVRSGSADGIAELAASLKRMGQVVPIKVRKVDDKYEIVYGHRRLQAARLAGLKEIEAIIESLDDNHAYAEAFIENMIREGMSAGEIKNALQEIAVAEGVESASALAELGYGSEATINRYWTLRYQRHEVQEIFDRPRDAQTVAVKAVEEISGAGLAEKVVVGKARPAILNNDGVAVLQKAAKETLSLPQTRAVAEAVAEARSLEMKQHLLKTPYSGLLHDKKAVRERPRVPAKTALKKDWSTSPEVTHIIDHLRTFQDRFEGWRLSADSGKFSPEAARFVAKRMREAARELMKMADYIERSTK